MADVVEPGGVGPDGAAGRGRARSAPRFGNLTLTAAEVNEALADALADRRTVASARDGFRAAVQRAAFERLVARRPEGLKLSDEVATARAHERRPAPRRSTGRGRRSRPRRWCGGC